MSTHSIVMQLRATTVAALRQTFAWTAFRISLGELEIGPLLKEKAKERDRLKGDETYGNLVLHLPSFSLFGKSCTLLDLL